MPRRPVSTTIVLSLFLPMAAARAGDRSEDVHVEPENIGIGLSYSGRTIRVTASVPACEGIVIRVTGADEPLALKKKGKKCGLLWMNVGEVHYEAVPTLYLLRSSRKLEELATPETLSRLGLGFDALRDRVPVESEDGARDLFGELVKLKERDRLFSSEASGVERSSLGAGNQQASSEFFLPAKTPVGDYTVDVYRFDHGDGSLVGSATVHLERDAVVAWITSFTAVSQWW
jgi:hypothetical protein